MGPLSGVVDPTLGNLTAEQLLACLALRISILERDIQQLTGKIDRSFSDRSMETRVRSLEDWRGGITAQLALAGGQVKWLYAFTAFVAALSGIVGHFWK